MVVIVKFIADIAIWLYLALAVVGFFLLLAIRAADRERSQSIFDLERDRATARLTKNLFYFFLLFFIASGIFYIQSELIKMIPLPEETPTPTAMVALPDTPTPPPLLPTPTSTLTPTPRPTLVVEFGSSPTPPPQIQGGGSGSPPNCPLPGAHITRPGNGATVSGVVQIIGTARIENFAYYKIEFRVPGQEWSFIESHETPAGEGVIATWNTATVPAGDYDFRLVVVDNTGNFPDPCQIRLRVAR